MDEGLRPVSIAVVEAVAPPAVVGLPGGDAVLDHDGRLRRVISHAQGHELLLTGGSHQLQQIRAGGPGRFDGQGHGGGPLALDGIGRCDELGRWLPDPRHLLRSPYQARTDPLVVAHAVSLHVERSGNGVHEQGDPVAGHRAHLAGEALDSPRGRDGIHPPGITRLGILGHDRRRDRELDAVDELGDHLGRKWRVAGTRLGFRAGSSGIGTRLVVVPTAGFRNPQGGGSGGYSSRRRPADEPTPVDPRGGMGRSGVSRSVGLRRLVSRVVRHRWLRLLPSGYFRWSRDRWLPRGDGSPGNTSELPWAGVFQHPAQRMRGPETALASCRGHAYARLRRAPGPPHRAPPPGPSTKASSSCGSESFPQSAPVSPPTPNG